jgi:exodeoxyribonuclease VII small subunit
VTDEPGEPPRRNGPAGRRPTGSRTAGETAAPDKPAGDKPAAGIGASGTGAGRPAGGGTGAELPAAEIPYERARDELTEVVRRLEGGGLTLEQSLELWERGERLAAICTQWLEGARARLAAALPPRDEPGEPGAPF